MWLGAKQVLDASDSNKRCVSLARERTYVLSALKYALSATQFGFS